MVGIGNHEQDHTVGGEKDPSGAKGEGFHPSWGNYGGDSGGECGVPMFNRYSYNFNSCPNNRQNWLGFVYAFLVPHSWKIQHYSTFCIHCIYIV